jgi:hypothetical protein
MVKTILHGGPLQWGQATQFLAAAELVRRNYTVSFTMGNHTPDADLMVGAVAGGQFWVDVKGQSAKGSWLVNSKPPLQNLYYILVLVGTARRNDRFFVLTQDEANLLILNYEAEHPKQSPGCRALLGKTPIGRNMKTVGTSCPALLLRAKVSCPVRL